MVERHYVWHGNDRQGRPCTGELDASQVKDVIEHLKKQRIRATRIHRQFKMPMWLQAKRKSKLSQQAISQFTRQLATLLRSGVDLLKAFEILGRGESSPALKSLVLAIHQKVESGISLNQALRQHDAFDALYCNLVAVGELAGALDVMLERLAEHLEKSEALRMTVKSALIYPAAILSVALLVLVMILIFVVPAFQNIFASFGAELPWLTRSIIALSEGVQRYGLIVPVIAMLVFFALRQQLRQRLAWQQHVHQFWLRLPIAGPLTRKACTARWTRTLATLFSAGVPLTEALDAVKGVTGNLIFQEATQSVQSLLIQGTSLSDALSRTPHVFPTMLIQMCAIGEESGALDHMLNKTAEHFEQEVSHTVARLSTLLEPVIMVVLGLLIGGLVMALYLPIFQLGQVV